MDNLVTDLNELPRLAHQHQDDFEVMRYMLELNDDISDADIDRWVDDIAQPIVESIDCTKCANCCRSLNVYLTESDAERLASGIHVSIDQIMMLIDTESAKPVREWGKFKAKPCGFLNGNLCRVYEHRPETCRMYPMFTPDFRWVMEDIIDGASICPIIYNVLLALHSRLDELYT